MVLVRATQAYPLLRHNGFTARYFGHELDATFCSRKIEDIGKMTALGQEEILQNTRTVVQGLEALKQVGETVD